MSDYLNTGYPIGDFLKVRNVEGSGDAFSSCENAPDSIESIIKRLIQVGDDGKYYLNVVRGAGAGIVSLNNNIVDYLIEDAATNPSGTFFHEYIIPAGLLTGNKVIYGKVFLNEIIDANWGALYPQIVINGVQVYYSTSVFQVAENDSQYWLEYWIYPENGDPDKQRLVFHWRLAPGNIASSDRDWET